MALTVAQAAQVQYCYETLEDVEAKMRAAGDPDSADALKRARREIETYAKVSGFNNIAVAAQTAAGITAAASLPRRGRLSK